MNYIKYFRATVETVAYLCIFNKNKKGHSHCILT